ncbi:MAG: MerR family transcriptional regulator [Pseudomonadota bacterium]
MKIGELASVTGLSADTLRYYEKMAVLDPPVRQANGYRHYNQQHVERLKFVQSAKALGFSLAEIVAFIPRLGVGQFGRAEIEHELRVKLHEVGREIARLQELERHLTVTFEGLSCKFDAPLSTGAATVDDPGQAVRVRPLKRANAP